jgi:hypothetical protein
MKRILQMLVASSFLIPLYSCQGQPGKQQGQELKNKIDAVMDVYHKPASKSGLYVEAKVDGEKWVADWLFTDPDPDKSFNVNGHKGPQDGGSVISFYISSRTVKEKGNKNFSEMNPVQMVDEKHNILTSNEGGYQITSVSGDWIEGNFHFTAKDIQTGKSEQVTDGFFRVSVPAKWKKDL